MTPKQAWNLKMIEAKLYDKLGDETEKGIYTIQETRSSTIKQTN